MAKNGHVTRRDFLRSSGRIAAGALATGVLG
jgi:hypothetical protein